MYYVIVVFMYISKVVRKFNNNIIFLNDNFYCKMDILYMCDILYNIISKMTLTKQILQVYYNSPRKKKLSITFI